jgi:hypothetical protein
MTLTSNRLFILIAILSAAFTLQTAQAGQTGQAMMVGADQLIIHLPDVDHERLIGQIRTLRSQQIQRKQALMEMVANRKPDGSDAILTVVMPGGLLYAGFKQARYEQAKSELARISADIEESTNDLLAMQSMSESILVARLP